LFDQPASPWFVKGSFSIEERERELNILVQKLRRVAVMCIALSTAMESFEAFHAF
jgi:hypothetical protein